MVFIVIGLDCGGSIGRGYVLDCLCCCFRVVRLGLCLGFEFCGVRSRVRIVVVSFVEFGICTFVFVEEYLCCDCGRCFVSVFRFSGFEL